MPFMQKDNEKMKNIWYLEYAKTILLRWGLVLISHDVNFFHANQMQSIKHCRLCILHMCSFFYITTTNILLKSTDKRFLWFFHSN